MVKHVGGTATSAGSVPSVSYVLPPNEQTISIQREKKGRGGKQVTVMRGFQLADKDLEKLGKRLKKGCGSGGTVKPDGIIEIQGDHREKIAALLQKQRFKTKFTGG
ncbi:Translation initiation factor SUI1-related protein [hydrothermal vent metagenome]|uniref:Translation initiation factor SUI1-related protein n=1 Tax=hydrothermal vent metagenome TaxID=652676 RepID=A0A3B0UL06_9ZZZZ